MRERKKVPRDVDASGRCAVALVRVGMRARVGDAREG